MSEKSKHDDDLSINTSGPNQIPFDVGSLNREDLAYLGDWNIVKDNDGFGMAYKFGIKEGIIYSFPVTCENGDYQYSKDNTIYGGSSGGMIDDDATQNYWGTTNEFDLPNILYDYYDTAGSLGKVLYSPILKLVVTNAGPK